MPTRFKTLAIAAALVAGTSSVALAQYACPAGYAYSYGACRPVAAPAPAPAYPSNPVSGAVSGGQAGAAQGAATGGPVGAIVGGAGHRHRNRCRHRQCGNRYRQCCYGRPGIDDVRPRIYLL